MQYIDQDVMEIRSVCLKFGKSVNLLVLANQVLLWRRLSVWLSENCFGSEDVLFEEALLDKFFQVHLEGAIVDTVWCLLESW